MQGLPDFGFLGSLSRKRRPQEVKPGSKHRYDWDIPDDARWALNPLVGGRLTLNRVNEVSQKDHKELPGIELSLQSVLLWMVGCEKQRAMEGVFSSFPTFAADASLGCFCPARSISTWTDVMGVLWGYLLDIAWDMQLLYGLACTKICRQLYSPRWSLSRIHLLTTPQKTKYGSETAFQPKSTLRKQIPGNPPNWNFAESA